MERPHLSIVFSFTPMLFIFLTLFLPCISLRATLERVRASSLSPSLLQSSNSSAPLAVAPLPSSTGGMQEVTDHGNTFMTIKINVGGQALQVIPDSGSFDLYLLSGEKCDSMLCEGAYNPNVSHTHSAPQQDLEKEIVFGSGAAEATLGFDTVQVLDESSPSAAGADSQPITISENGDKKLQDAQGEGEGLNEKSQTSAAKTEGDKKDPIFPIWEISELSDQLASIWDPEGFQGILGVGFRGNAGKDSDDLVAAENAVMETAMKERNGSGSAGLLGDAFCLCMPRGDEAQAVVLSEMKDSSSSHGNSTQPPSALVELSSKQRRIMARRVAKRMKFLEGLMGNLHSRAIRAALQKVVDKDSSLLQAYSGKVHSHSSPSGDEPKDQSNEEGAGHHGVLWWGEKTPQLDWASTAVVGTRHWAMEMPKMQVGLPGFLGVGGGPIMCADESKCAVLVDSGTSLIALPENRATTLIEETEIANLETDCSNVNSMPDMLIDLAEGKQITLTPSTYIMKVEADADELEILIKTAADKNLHLKLEKALKKIHARNEKIKEEASMLEEHEKEKAEKVLRRLKEKETFCTPAFMSTPIEKAWVGANQEDSLKEKKEKEREVWVFGIPFFREYYVRFDRKEGTMGFAKHVEDKCTSNPAGAFALAEKRQQPGDKTAQRDLRIHHLPAISKLRFPTTGSKAKSFEL